MAENYDDFLTKIIDTYNKKHKITSKKYSYSIYVFFDYVNNKYKNLEQIEDLGKYKNAEQAADFYLGVFNIYRTFMSALTIYSAKDYLLILEDISSGENL